MCPTRETRNDMWCSRKKRWVVGVENVVDEEEYNQFDEVPPFGSCNLPVILESETTPYLRSGDNVKGVTNAKGRKSR